VTPNHAPTLPDHSFIIAIINLQFNHSQPAIVVRRRQWSSLTLCIEIYDRRRMLTDPPSDAEGLLACYNTTTMTLVDIGLYTCIIRRRQDTRSSQFDVVRLRMSNKEDLDAPISWPLLRKEIISRSRGLAHPVQVSTFHIQRKVRSLLVRCHKEQHGRSECVLVEGQRATDGLSRINVYINSHC